ncbi:MAG TPA: PaaI family thioesterase [Bradyrhizobium sp.]|nr:PaaI family thioesterase [Bradyrhizobium sp.]
MAGVKVRRAAEIFRCNDEVRKPRDKRCAMTDACALKDFSCDTRRYPSDKSGTMPMQNCSASKTYGTVSAERRNEMSGLEFVQGLADGTLPLNTIAQTLRYDVAEAVNGRVVVTAEPSGIHLNPAGTVHGGFSATLLDSCMGLAVQSTLEKGFGQTTLEFKISLVRPITPETGELKAEGVVLSRGRRVGTAEGRITDRAGRLLAHGTTTCLIFEN